MQEKYLEFLRYAIDNKKAVPESVKDIDWHGLFEFSKKQAIIGVVFDAIQRLNIKWDGHIYNARNKVKQSLISNL